MLAQTILTYSLDFALALLPISFFITVLRVILGPTLPDRVVALDMLVAIAIGFIAVIALKTGYYLYIDIAIALGLVGFLATVAFARFILVNSNRLGADSEQQKMPAQSKPRQSKRKTT
jgi:multicomponent Na+:H+ antiporter subunit F